jgi:hypothetical protein
MAEQFLALIVTMLPALQNIERRLDQEAGRRFNIFENIFTPNEVATSRVLAFLIDPAEAHGQGDVFLRAFIRKFVPKWQGTFSFSKACKALTSEQIDVVISDGTHWLGIENKIFNAPEQKRQAGRYLEALQQKALDQESYRLIYLSPTGTEPSNYSLPPCDKELHGSNLVIGAWALPSEDDDQPAAAISVLDWLVECRNQCRAESVAWLLRQFSNYLNSVIAGIKEADMADTAIVGLALRDPKNLDAALRIGENYGEIKRVVVKNFLQFIYDGLQAWAKERGEDWEVLTTWPSGSWIDKPDKKHLPVLLRKKSWPTMVGVAITAEQNGPHEVFIGIHGPTEKAFLKDSGASAYDASTIFIGQESRNRIVNAITAPVKQRSDWWVFYDEYMTDSTGQSIFDWRDSTIVIRLNSEQVTLGNFIIGRITSLAASISGLVINAS